jgi:predicted DsbA family dithiol-disulfide isomerase
VPIIWALVERVSIAVSTLRFAHLHRILGNYVPVELRYQTDPACSWSWGSEPKLRKLMWEFDGELDFAWVMGGLARHYGPDYKDAESGIGMGIGSDPFSDLMLHWLDSSAESGMPCDPRVWRQNPITSTYPACQAVKAAAEQGSESAYAYLRRLREGLLVERKKLDHFEALVAEAEPAGLDVERFRIDLSSAATIEAFATDLDRTQAVADEAPGAKAKESPFRERPSFPSATFSGPGGERHAAWGWQPYEAYREAALAAGASVSNPDPLAPADALERFGRIATKEAEVLSERPRPVVEAELWRLATDWRARPIPVLVGVLWEKS